MGRIHGNSTANAQGPMQFLPSTWARYGGGGDIQSDHDSIQAAARFLVANGGLTDMRAALRHYNQADSYVTAVTLYAKQMQVNERYYYGFYQWQVLYKHVSGRLILPAGYPDISPIPVTDAAGSFLAGP